MRRSLLPTLAILLLAHSSQAQTLPSIDLTVEVRDLATNTPVPNAEIIWSSHDKAKGSATTSSTGQVGVAQITLPPKSRWATLKVVHPNSVPLVLYWNAPTTTSNKDDTTSTHLTFLLEKPLPIGGQVLDDAGNPVPNVHIELSINKPYPNSPQRVLVPDNNILTDANGRWTYPAAPADPSYISIAAWDHKHLTRDSYTQEPYKPLADLYANTATLKLPPATPFEITVTKPDGSPAPNALIRLGSALRYGNGISPAKTDDAGKTTLGIKPGSTLTLTAMLDGYGAVQKTITATTNPTPLSFQLVPTAERTIEIVDRQGNPIPKATVSISRLNKDYVFPGTLTTDAQGRATWNAGPAGDNVFARVYAEGFVGIGSISDSEFSWPSGVVHRITLARRTGITATVTDAETGASIPNFTIRTGTIWEPNQRLVWQRYDWLKDQSTLETGYFTARPTTPAHRYQLRVEAPGYYAEDSPLLDMNDEADKNLTFRLKPGTPITGTILSPNGKPAEGARIILLKANDWLSINNGELGNGDEKSALSTLVDSSGHFSLPPQREDFLLLAISNTGFAKLTSTEYKTNPVLKLQPFATVRGSLLIDGKPAANFGIQGAGEQLRVNDDVVGSAQYAIKTNANGSYEITRVLPGPLIINRWVDNHAPERMFPIGIARADIQPGDSLDLTPPNRSITGQLDIPSGKPWMIRQAQLQLKGQPHPEDWHNVAINDNGAFRADGLQPGDYTLKISLHEFPPGNSCGWGRLVGDYTADVTVTDNQPTLSLGTLKPKALPPANLAIGDTAPDIEFKTTDGKTLHLSDLKGKTVLLDFWATWCAPCIAEIPNLKSIHDELGKDNRFVLLSLSLDDSQKSFAQAIPFYKMTWTQSRIGIDSAPVRAYGATAIPATFLIGPDGKVLARDLRGDALKKAVEAALQK